MKAFIGEAERRLAAEIGDAIKAAKSKNGSDIWHVYVYQGYFKKGGGYNQVVVALDSKDALSSIYEHQAQMKENDPTAWGSGLKDGFLREIQYR